jgi:hypothetical protein
MSRTNGSRSGANHLVQRRDLPYARRDLPYARREPHPVAGGPPPVRALVKLDDAPLILYTQFYDAG